MSGTDTETTGAPPRFVIELETESPCLKRLQISVDGAHVAATRRKEAKKLGKTVRIKGFRKGKVPPHVLEDRYGPAIDERTLTALVNEGYREALEREDIQPVGDPIVSDVSYEAGSSLSYAVEVEVMPELALERTAGFRVERPTFTVGDSDVDEILENMRGDHAVLEPVERRPADGDVVSVTIRPAVGEGDEQPEERPYRFELGAGYAIPDVEDAIRTLEPGTDGRFEVRYPDDFGSSELAGATRDLVIRLVDVRQKRLPEIDDDFAAQVGDFDTLDELRTAIRDDVAAHREREADDAVREKLIDEILGANPFEVPPSLVTRYLERVIDAPEDADPERVEEARRNVRPAVVRQIKRDLVLEHVIEERGLETTKEELDARIAEIAANQGLEPLDVRQRLAREKQLDQLRHRMAVDKAFAFLLEGSEVR